LDFFKSIAHLRISEDLSHPNSIDKHLIKINSLKCSRCVSRKNVAAELLKQQNQHIFHLLRSIT